MAPEEKLLTIEEVAQLLSVTVHAVRKWKSDGLITYVKIGSTLRFHPDDVRDFIDARKTNRKLHESEAVK